MWSSWFTQRWENGQWWYVWLFLSEQLQQQQGIKLSNVYNFSSFPFLHKFWDLSRFYMAFTLHTKH